MPTSPIPESYWPGPTTTGVPAGTRLTPSNALELRTDGQVVSNLHITGWVNVYAKNVVIRKSRITCKGAATAIRTFDPLANLTVEDVEIDGTGQCGAAVCCANYLLRRVNIHDVIDGPRLGSRTTVLDSWIHDLARIAGLHSDCLQANGGSDIVVRHNRLDAYRASTGDAMDACLMVGPTAGTAINKLLFEDNLCNGGEYSVNVRGDLAASNMVFRGNRFGRNSRYGAVVVPPHPKLTWEATNVWYDTGRAVTG